MMITIAFYYLHIQIILVSCLNDCLKYLYTCAHVGINCSNECRIAFLNINILICYELRKDNNICKLLLLNLSSILTQTK